MEEVDITHTSPHSEVQDHNNSKIGRPRFCSSTEKCIRVNTEKQKAKKRRRTRIIRKLHEEGRDNQNEMVKMFLRKKYNKEWVDLIKREPLALIEVGNNKHPTLQELLVV